MTNPRNAYRTVILTTTAGKRLVTIAKRADGYNVSAFNADADGVKHGYRSWDFANREDALARWRWAADVNQGIVKAEIEDGATDGTFTVREVRTARFRLA